MKLLSDGKAPAVIQDKRIIFIDNNFLGLIYHDAELLGDTVVLLAGKQVYLYPFTEFEFLRDVFAPQQRALKEQFIVQALFGHIKEDNHMKFFPKFLKNALLLSKIFAHQSGNHKKNTSSFVDLLLASVLMYLTDKAILITGNKKDFPSCVFDTLSVLNTEQEDGHMKAICLIGFNQGKFDSCYKELSALEKKIA